MALTNHARSPHSPSPIYGIRPGFTVADLEPSRVTALHVYGTYQAGSLTPTWNAQTGRWTVVDALTAQATATDSTGVVVSPNARVVKIGTNVTGTGSVVITVKSAVDSYTATVATYTLTATNGFNKTGHTEFFLGGWSSPSSDGTSYVATQYGPNLVTVGGILTQGSQEEATSTMNPAADSNYVGQTYNPFQFLSLDGYSLKFFATVTGSVGYDLNVIGIS